MEEGLHPMSRRSRERQREGRERQGEKTHTTHVSAHAYWSDRESEKCGWTERDTNRKAHRDRSLDFRQGEGGRQTTRDSQLVRDSQMERETETRQEGTTRNNQGKTVRAPGGAGRGEGARGLGERAADLGGTAGMSRQSPGGPHKKAATAFPGSHKGRLCPY